MRRTTRGVVEQAPSDRRAFFDSWSLIGSTGGILLGSAVGALISNLTTDAQQESWGWRLPFHPTDAGLCPGQPDCLAGCCGSGPTAALAYCSDEVFVPADCATFMAACGAPVTSCCL